MRHVDDNLLPGEQVIYWAKLHWSFYLAAVPWILASMIAGVWLMTAQASTWRSFLCLPALIAFCGGFLMLGAAALAAGNTEFAITNRRVVAKTGVWRSRSLDIMLTQVESIKVTQPLFGLIFDYGTVVVSGTGGTEESFPHISDPQGLRFQLHSRVRSAA